MQNLKKKILCILMLFSLIIAQFSTTILAVETAVEETISESQTEAIDSEEVR